MKRTMMIVAIGALLALPAMGGEWHSGSNLLCTDCHTMHFAMEHDWAGASPVPTTPAADGNWLGATGPNHYLLKLPANELCLTCHDGQTFAPDVYGTNTNASPTQGRMAGALNGAFGTFSPGAGYDDWKGHTMETTDRPPGYNPDVISAGSDPYPVGSQLECVNCHAQHGPTTAYRNLGPFGWGFGVWSQARPTYVINTTNDITKDVWINIAPASYTPNTGAAGTFNPYYDYANIFYNRIDADNGTAKTSNKINTVCGTCHGDFHGGPADAQIGGIGAPATEFERHPTSQMTIGQIGGGHSGLGFYTSATTKTKVYTTDYVGYTDATPGCVSCHKAHGNQNPFAMFFLHGAASGIDEEGGYAAAGLGVVGNEMPNGYGIAYQNLCGQCHTQGINWNE